MKRLTFILLTITILLSFCACSNENNINETSLKTTTQEQKSTMADTSKTKKIGRTITVRVGDKSFIAQLYDNETAKVFADMLPLTLDMNELHGNEKYYNLDSSLPTNSLNIGAIKSGDIMLYGSDCIVLFYDSFSTNYSYTKIGYIENPTELADAVGNGDVTITFDKPIQ